MTNISRDKIHELDCLTAELDSLYHQAAVRLGLSDSVMRVLYAVYDQGESCLLSDVYKQSGISKQTINSAVRRLEAEGILYLEGCGGRAKRILLTADGKQFAAQTIAHIFVLENNIFAAWSEEEFEMYLGLTRKFAGQLRQSIARLPERRGE